LKAFLEIIESDVSSPFVKTEAYLVEYVEKSGDNHPKHFRQLIM
jgi:hypothetical protein